MANRLGRVIYKKEEIEERIRELADLINRDYKDSEEVILVGVMKGVFSFYAQLIKHLKINCFVDFITASSYDGVDSTHEIKIVKDIDSSIKNKDVLLIDCVIDTGLTLHYLHTLLSCRNPRSIKIAVLIDKQVPRLANVHVDYVGFKTPNIFLVGYGLDVDGRYRQLDHITCVES